MGRMFDSMIDLVGRLKLDSTFDPIKQAIHKGVIFEFPGDVEQLDKANEIRASGDLSFYSNYLKLSREYERVFLSPFETTLLEDDKAVYCLSPLNSPNEFIYFTYNHSRKGMISSYVSIENRVNGLEIQVGDSFKLNESGTPVLDSSDEMSQLMFHSTLNVIRTNAIIMDPDHYIIREESPEYKRAEKTNNQQQLGNWKRKTKVRPKYVCIPIDDLADYVEDRNKDPSQRRIIHPVRSHARIYTHERYVNMQGKEGVVKQHLRGSGIFEGLGGWKYQVYLKSDPVTLTPSE